MARWRVYFGTALRLPEKVAHACHHHSYSITTGSNGDTQRVPPCEEDRRTKILSGNMTYVNLFKCLSSSFQINIIPVKVERILWGLLINTQNPYADKAGPYSGAQFNLIQPRHPSSLEAPTLTMLRLGDLNSIVMHQRAAAPASSSIYATLGLFLNNALTIWHKMPENVPQIEGFHKSCYSILNGNRGLYTHKRKPRTLEEKLIEGVTLTQCTLLHVTEIPTPKHMRSPPHQSQHRPLQHHGIARRPCISQPNDDRRGLFRLHPPNQDG